MDDWKHPEAYEKIVAGLATIMATYQKLKGEPSKRKKAEVTQKDLREVLEHIGQIIKLLGDMINVDSQLLASEKDMNHMIRALGKMVDSHGKVIYSLQMQSIERERQMRKK